MQGLLLVDKPIGWTSFDVVNYVRKIVANAEGKKPKHVKVGHTGTLDPFATGLLVLLIGKDYTRRAGELAKLDKTYELAMRLGETSTTGDPEGEIRAPYSGPAPSRQALEAALESLRGVIKQTPPVYSAIKINGQRAYKLARAGQRVVIEPRSVKVNILEVVKYAFPEADLMADVSSGTYIRTLVEDLGQTLGTGAYTVALRRTRAGAYTLGEAVHISELNATSLEERLLTLC